MPSGRFWPAISSTPLSPVRQLVIIDSKTEHESEGLYINNDEESVIENQAGLPKSQHCIAKSSPPPPASDNDVNHNLLNDNGEFFLEERWASTKFSVS